MNTKTKMMLGLSVLTAGTLAAGATGTFAWFTTNKSATATYNNIIAAGTQGNIQASIKGITDETAKGQQGATTTAKGSASYISDVSSNDGIKFVQPDWAGESGNSKTANSLLDVSEKSGYFTQYNITIVNTASKTDNSSNKVKVVLNSMSLTSTYEAMLPWTRVAVITQASFSAVGKTDATSAAGVYTSAVITGTNDKYVSALTTNGALTLETSSVKPTSDLGTNKIEIGTLAAGESKEIGISVWLEGTANGNTAQDGAKSQSVNVALEFTATAVVE